MDVELRHTVCRLIAGLVVSDDDFAPEEELFIERMLKRFGVSDRETIFPIVGHDEAAARVRELPREVQEEAMSLLIEAAAVDGRVTDEETAYLRVVGDAIGVSAAALEQRVQAALRARARG